MATHAARAVVATLIKDRVAGAVAVQAKRVADTMAVGSLAMHVAGDVVGARTLGCDWVTDVVVVTSVIATHWHSCCGGDAPRVLLCECSRRALLL